MFALIIYQIKSKIKCRKIVVLDRLSIYCALKLSVWFVCVAQFVSTNCLHSNELIYLFAVCLYLYGFDDKVYGVWSKYTEIP